MWLMVGESSNRLVEKKYKLKVCARLGAFMFVRKEKNAEWVNVFIAKTEP